MIFDQIGLHAQDPWRRTVEEADLARRLDPTLPAPHSVLARVAQLRDWDFETADRLAMRAIELAPGEETWYRHRALLLSALGQHEEAIAMGRRSVELDPLATGAHRQLGGIFFNARRFAEGLASVDQALALSPGHGYALMRKAAILSMLDRHSEAAAVADSSVARDSDDPFVVAISGWVHARAGDTAAARHWLRELEQRTTGTHYARAIVHTGLGENERAIELLEAAFALRYPLLFELAALPVFDPLRGDPRIDRLLREIGVPPCDDCPGR
jgi:serine/threonine-protein kinase